MGLGIAALLAAPSPGQAGAAKPGTPGIFGHKGSGPSIFVPAGARPQNPDRGTTGIFGHTNSGGITGLFGGIENTVLPGPVGRSISSPEYRPPGPSVGLVLTGVVIAGDRALGFVQDPKLTNNKIVTVRTGDRVGPYTVIAIESDRINLEGPTGLFTIRLARQTGTPAGATLGASPSAPSSSQLPRGSTARQGSARGEDAEAEAATDQAGPATPAPARKEP